MRPSADPRRALEIEDAITQLHGMMSASLRHLLKFVEEFDRMELWRGDGATTMEHWLIMRLSVSYRTAKDWVDSARALHTLPQTAEAFGEGRLSWDQTRELTRFATPDKDEELAREAPGWSAADLKRRAVTERSLSKDEANQTYRERYLRLRWDEAARTLRIWGQVSDSDGAVVEKALTRIAQQAPPEANSDTYNFERSCADALVQLASIRLGADPDVDRATIVAHVDAKALESGEGIGHLENGIPLHAEQVRRLACDGRLQPLVENGGRRPFGVGRASRKLPVWLLRHVKDRDGGCRFPGCTYDRWLHAHHIRHWASGGPTDSENLVMLCGYHHRLVHDGGWVMKAHDDRTLEFIRPDGRALDPGPLALRAEIRTRFFGNGEEEDARGDAERLSPGPAP
ncbi:MAG: DUF222 domain-containing protein [Actinomycetota bacterium]